MGFKAFRIDRDDKAQGGVRAGFVTMDEGELDAGDVLIRVVCSSVNYKDALAATGRERIVRRLPCVGGVDLAGTVVRSAAPRFQPGDAVIATSYEIGVAHHGGYAELALMPGGWVLPCPAGLDLSEAMAVGTAGLTAALAITRMEDAGLKPERGPVLVTGASGGVGSLAIDMLAGRGYEVVALTGKAETSDWLRSLGATRVMLRDELALDTVRPLDKAVWAGAIDNLGGAVLSWLLASTKPTGVVASVGLAADTVLNTTVMPFVLRGVSLLGIDSVYAGFGVREKAWARIAADLRPRHLASIAREVNFEALPEVFESLVAGGSRGRTVVRIASERQNKDET
ncbi:MAG: oxidoreductase [Candidatus Dactylopiibacterium carminicum]|uniref:Oxidoreductase n=1 Tax=Candidatus Dactylopiibacterium carminicum TaxID=857335 RepID=A0A272ETJ1_9RHOO|nr:oxidoreductase [Candidatus Dactylopiibacterium carminicum]KAF7599418.1 oxidoreductase [Candidatus Dactylopiibacterium carminicum]PAS93424.1 MAG: oxidoreductase [Candidatus Dactylopiibacterium carminicum]PAS95943.1 MAG: oxidoreductase [Candidatus Dactylopiibacterium carminicum]PAS99427.1 MAG: oxidoreductase [Candidatus Dactylopiibacterium carminicum]